MEPIKILIKNACYQKGISLKEVAKKIGLSESGFLKTIGNSKIIKLHTLCEIAKVLNVPISYFFNDSDKVQINTASNDLYIENLSQKHEIEKLKHELLIIYRELHEYKITHP
jgi:transcriptional regulator with XRE-family HTH domain